MMSDEEYEVGTTKTVNRMVNAIVLISIAAIIIASCILDK